LKSKFFGFSVVVLTVSFVVNLGVWIFVIVLTTSFGVSIFLLSIFGFSCVLTTPFGVSNFLFNWTIGFFFLSSSSSLSSLLEEDEPFDFSIFKLFEIEVFGFSPNKVEVEFNLGVWITFVVLLTTTSFVNIFFSSSEEEEEEEEVFDGNFSTGFFVTCSVCFLGFKISIFLLSFSSFANFFFQGFFFFLL